MIIRKLRQKTEKKPREQTLFKIRMILDPMKLSYTTLKVTKKWTDNTLENVILDHPSKVWDSRDGENTKRSLSNNWVCCAKVATRHHMQASQNGPDADTPSSGHVYTVAEDA